MRGKNQSALAKAITRNLSGDFYLKYSGFFFFFVCVSLWNPNPLGHGGEADSKLSFQFLGLKITDI